MPELVAPTNKATRTPWARAGIAAVLQGPGSRVNLCSRPFSASIRPRGRGRGIPSISISRT